MSSDLSVRGAGRYIATTNDVVISDPDEMENELTRRILRTELVVNKHDPRASVKASIMHQKRGPKNRWEDADSFSLASLKAGQEIRLQLSARQTYRLYQALQQRYAVVPGDWERDQARDYVLVKKRDRDFTEHEKEVIEQLLEREGEQLLTFIAETKPDLLQMAAIIERHEERVAVLRDFERQLEENQWKEGEWEAFFRANTWIFGHNLAFQFLSTVENQPYYVGPSAFGQGAQRGDFLMATNADARFTVVVDIKKPSSRLVSDRPYRNQVYQLGVDLVGGAAQVQSNCYNWAGEGSRDPRNVKSLAKQNIHTYEPKGILIIGHTSQLDDDDKVATFELFRRNLRTPEVLTYDELLERARFIVEMESKEFE